MQFRLSNITALRQQVMCDVWWFKYCVIKGSVPDSMPAWMDNLSKKFTSPGCPFNIRLFIAKLILNTEQV